MDWVVNIFKYGIILLAVVIFFLILGSGRKFRKVLEEVNGKNNLTVGDLHLNRDDNTVEKLLTDKVEIEAMDNPRKNFNSSIKWYSSFVQSITIFPLLGLLGTVIGLIPGLEEMSSAGNIDVLYSSLSTALYTTLYGLIASIVLKIETCFIDPTISEIEDTLVEFDRTLDFLQKYGK